MTEGLQLTPAAARTVLARAFVDDPLMAWSFPDAESRPHAVGDGDGRSVTAR